VQHPQEVVTAEVVSEDKSKAATQGGDVEPATVSHKLTLAVTAGVFGLLLVIVFAWAFAPHNVRPQSPPPTPRQDFALPGQYEIEERMYQEELEKKLRREDEF
jgi:hypothetical protein